jgi:hypothetical protein
LVDVIDDPIVQAAIALWLERVAGYTEVFPLAVVVRE